jgi:hypothetical protein
MDASQMREQFESRFVEEYVRVLGEGARELAAHALAANSPVVSMSWWAWQASRAVVVGELQPKKHSIECRLEVSQDTLSTIRGCLRAAESDIDQLKAEGKTLLKDAERYRWLRDQCGLVEYKAIAGSIGPGMLPCGEELQEAIDAAMAKEASHG